MTSQLFMMGPGLSQQGVRVSFGHTGPRKIPILGGESFGQNLSIVYGQYDDLFFSARGF